QEEAQDRGGDQHEREDRDERVVRHDRRQVRALVVEELVDDRDREADDRMAPLEAVDPADDRHDRYCLAAATTRSYTSRSRTAPSRRTSASRTSMNRLRRTSLGLPLASHGPDPMSIQYRPARASWPASRS